MKIQQGAAIQQLNDSLQSQILAKSKSQQMPKAIKEWAVTEHFEYEESIKCICGRPMLDAYTLMNSRTGEALQPVGHGCIQNMSADNPNLLRQATALKKSSLR